MRSSSEEWELWTWREVARALKVSRSWIYAKAGSGELPSLRVGGLLRFDPAQVRRFTAPGPAGGRVSLQRASGEVAESD
jgi:excisionase family DNA binding protein